MIPHFEAILFDLDGTLVDSLPGIAWAAQTALTEVRPGSELPDLRPFVGPPIREIFRQALKIDDAAMLDGLEASFRRHYNSRGWRHTVAYADVSQTLTALHAAKVRLGVVTNKPQVPTRSILAHLDLARFMEIVVTPDSVSPAYATKTRALAAALSTLSIIPGRSLFVGDSGDDAAAAAGCGLRFAAVTYGYGDAFLQTAHPVALRFDCLGVLCTH
jgi:phosphoglycolate phosphatase